MSIDPDLLAKNKESESEFSLRIHIDWWGKCRTCKEWDGERVQGFQGKCDHPQGVFRGSTTTSEGRCPDWESYDYEGACAALDWDKLPHHEKFPVGHSMPLGRRKSGAIVPLKRSNSKVPDPSDLE